MIVGNRILRVGDSILRVGNSIMTGNSIMRVSRFVIVHCAVLCCSNVRDLLPKSIVSCQIVLLEWLPNCIMKVGTHGYCENGCNMANICMPVNV